MRNIWILIVIAIVVSIVYTATIYSNNEHFITIRYFDNENENVEYATEIISQDKNCVRFKNALGLEQSVCAENISITKFK